VGGDAFGAAPRLGETGYGRRIDNSLFKRVQMCGGIAKLSQ